MINKSGVVNNHTTFLNEAVNPSTAVDRFHEIFLKKLKYRLGVLSKNTSISDDDKVKILASNITTYFDNIIKRVNSYYSPLIKNIQTSIESFDYNTILQYIDNIEYNLYTNLLDKISKDRTLKLEKVDFNDNDLFTDLSDLFTNIIASIGKSLKRADKELKDNNTGMKTIHNNFKSLPPTLENEKNLKDQVIRALPDALRNSINGVIERAEEIKTEYTDKSVLKNLI